MATPCEKQVAAQGVVEEPIFSTSSSDRSTTDVTCESAEQASAPPHSEATPSDTREGLSKARHMILVASMFLTLFLPALDQTIVSTALPRILSSLSAAGGNDSDAGYTWIGSAYALAQAVVLPVFGQVSEVVGRKWTFLTAIAIFTIGSALCGASQNVTMLIASRTVQGVGAGGVTSLVLILIGDLVGTRLIACLLLAR